ncbi:E3 ubiquitin-protein ligase XIAP-like [Gigantopelta aegis]|uniref:E3 ubiquitin-protein ligase XIAP-like n=1 Tax=Gigantopelta aegis TaxID=1735272 RepID=UPI001B88815B|nr:E3 ubiquitin-protein ligase XIAP-like [Gigantopelta aegis]
MASGYSRMDSSSSSSCSSSDDVLVCKCPERHTIKCKRVATKPEENYTDQTDAAREPGKIVDEEPMNTREHVDEEPMDQTDSAREYKTDSAPYDDAYDAGDEWNGLSRYYLFCHRPEIRGFYRRLYTFARWPLQMKQRPRELVKAGFFYTGDHDAIICYCCRLRVYGWKKMDDPVMEHYWLSQRCPYVNNVFRH